MLERAIERRAKMDLILSIDTGNGCQDGFKGTKCFCWPLGEFDYKCSAPKILVNPTSLLNW